MHQTPQSPPRGIGRIDRRTVSEGFPWITTSAGAALLGVSRHLVAAWAREGKVYGTRCGVPRSRQWLVDVRSLKAYADLNGYDPFRPAASLEDAPVVAG